MYKIAVLIPAYNEEENIAETLKSLLKQTVKPSLILIGDNESTDNTAEVARALLESQGFKRYVIIKVKRFPDLGKLNINLVYSALNKALKIIGEDFDYIATIEADVALEEKYFEKLIKHFEENPKLCIAGGRLEPLGLPQDPFPLTIKANLWGGNRLYRAKCWLELNNEIDIAQLPAWDTDHVVLAILKGYHVAQIPNATSKTTRNITKFHGKPKGTTDALHGLPIWWALFKTIQLKDLEYLIWYMVTKIQCIEYNRIKQLQCVYYYAAHQAIFRKLRILDHLRQSNIPSLNAISQS